MWAFFGGQYDFLWVVWVFLDVIVTFLMHVENKVFSLNLFSFSLGNTKSYISSNKSFRWGRALSKFSRRSWMLITSFLLSISVLIVTFNQSIIVASEDEGFLIITRELFVDSLDDYVQWKTLQGFDVTVVTAEWINDNVEGEDLRFKIRNCLRNYYYTENVQYAMIVGDSVNLDFDSEAEEWQEPPAPVLSESWNLPAGYYRWDCWNQPQFTSLFYSDLSDKLYYGESEYYYDGDFSIYVGIVPVRTPVELQTILLKTMLSPYYTYSDFTCVVSDDLYSSGMQDTLASMGTIAGSDVSMNVFVFGNESLSEDIREKLFEQQGVVMEHGHGNHGIFKIGETIISNDDAVNFQFINPLVITSSCLVQAYHMSDRGLDVDCLDEAFLKAEKGPALITTGEPWGASYGEILSVQEIGFWEDLFGGKSVGQALYDHCDGAWQNPIFLFGDPSLVAFGEPEIDLDPPDIAAVTQFPLDNVMMTDSVSVNSTVVDQESGVSEVFLEYTSGNGTWLRVEMSELAGDVWTSTIPPFSYDTNVTYRIITNDYMGNSVTSEDLGYEYEYTVVPEFAAWLFLPFLMLAMLSAIIAGKVKDKRSKSKIK